MTLKIVITIECNGCGTILEVEPQRLNKSNEYAAGRGWLCYGLRSHHCPDCRGTTDHLQPEYTPVEFMRFLEPAYSLAFFKHWAIKPIINKTPSPEQLQKRVEQVNRRLDQYDKQYGEENIFYKRVNADSLRKWLEAFDSAPYDDWRAFITRQQQRDLKNAQALHHNVEQVIEDWIDYVMEELGGKYDINELTDDINKEIAARYGDEMHYADSDIRFPSPAMVQVRINRRQ